jgi:hypothetical protein
MAAESYWFGLAGFCAYVVLFLILRRLRPQTGWFLLELTLGILVGLLAAVAGFLWLDEFSIWYHTALFAFLWLCFFFVSSIYSVSVSVGIIRYLQAKPGHAAEADEIYRQCVVEPFVERVEFLAASEQVQNTEGGYRLTSQGQVTVRRLRAIQSLFGMTNRGFYTAASRPIDRDGT